MAYGVYSDRGYREHILERNKNTNKKERLKIFVVNQMNICNLQFSNTQKQQTNGVKNEKSNS